MTQKESMSVKSEKEKVPKHQTFFPRIIREFYDGTDIIRYLSFEQDPVLTITGPNATNLKSSLEKQF